MLNYSGFVALLEGGKTILGARRIEAGELDGLVKAIRRPVERAIGCSVGEDLIRVGSTLKSDLDSFGDLDLCLVASDYARRHNISEDSVESHIFEALRSAMPHKEVRWKKSVNVVCLGWPLGDGVVQVDFIPVSSREWAEFAYNTGEGSSYSGSHRNWLYCAIISTITDSVVKGGGTDLEPEEFSGYMMRLPRGLTRVTKTRLGQRGLTKGYKIVSEEPVTDVPSEFVRFVFGDEIDPVDVDTFEKAWEVAKLTRRDSIEKIASEFRRFLDRVGLSVPEGVPSGSES